MDIFEAFDSEDPLARFRSWVSERFARFRLTGAIALSLFLGGGASSLWEQVLLFLNKEDFNIFDPVLDMMYQVTYMDYLFTDYLSLGVFS